MANNNTKPNERPDPPLLAARGLAARRRVRQSIAEIPPGLEWCKDRALKLISRSGPEQFDDYVTWAKWCRNVAGAGLMQDPDRLEMFEKQGGVTLPPNSVLGDTPAKPVSVKPDDQTT